MAPVPQEALPAVGQAVQGLPPRAHPLPRPLHPRPLLFRAPLLHLQMLEMLTLAWPAAQDRHVIKLGQPSRLRLHSLVAGSALIRIRIRIRINLGSSYWKVGGLSRRMEGYEACSNILRSNWIKSLQSLLLQDDCDIAIVTLLGLELFSLFWNLICPSKEQIHGRINAQ